MRTELYISPEGVTLPSPRLEAPADPRDPEWRAKMLLKVNRWMDLFLSQKDVIFSENRKTSLDLTEVYQALTSVKKEDKE